MKEQGQEGIVVRMSGEVWFQVNRGGKEGYMSREKEETKLRIVYHSHELTKFAPLMAVLTRLVLKLRRLALLLITFAMVLILLLTFPTPRAAPTPAVNRPPAWTGC